jgi:hypothetical protein
MIVLLVSYSLDMRCNFDFYLALNLSLEIPPIKLPPKGYYSAEIPFYPRPLSLNCRLSLLRLNNQSISHETESAIHVFDKSS